MGVGSSQGASSGKRSSLPDGRRDAGRERIIDAALELFARQGFDATTIDQVAATAGVWPADFAEHFPTTEAVLLSIVDDMTRGTAAALASVEKGGDPERALLQAGTAALASVFEGHGATSLDRLLAMARTVTTTRNLQRKVSAARKRVLTQPLADWMGVDPKNRRLQHALTIWSAVTASAYVSALNLPDRDESDRSDRLEQRMIANLSQSYGDVLGEDPDKSE